MREKKTAAVNIRTTEARKAALKRKAKRDKVDVVDLVERGIDMVLAEEKKP